MLLVVMQMVRLTSRFHEPPSSHVLFWGPPGFQAGSVIGLPPVLNFANPQLKEKVVNAVLSGKTVSTAKISPSSSSSLNAETTRRLPNTISTSVWLSPKLSWDPTSKGCTRKLSRARMGNTIPSTGRRSGSRVGCMRITL